MIQVSVIISTWNRCTSLQSLLEKLVTQTFDHNFYEIIVCDSHSNDGTVEMVLKFVEKFSNLRLINTENTLVKKRNIGVNKSLGEIIIFLDDDLLVENDFIEQHTKYHQNEDNYFVSGQVRYPKEWVEISNYFKFRDSRHLKGSARSADLNDLDFYLIVAMNLSCKKSNFEVVGCFDDDFVKYGGEDIEFGFRVKKSGFKIIFAEKALGWHYEFGGNVEKYAKKIYMSSRFTSEILLKKVPELNNHGMHRFFDGERSKLGQFTEFVLYIFSFFCKFNTLAKILQKYDDQRYLVPARTYLFLQALTYLQAKKDRGIVNDTDSWF
jgi:glycosyltransferase involved in cell wall biosynthesis